MDPKNIDSALSVLEKRINDLPETVELWPEQPEHWRVSLMVEWSFRMSEFEMLHGFHRAGQMSSAHAQRYQQLARQLRSYLPIVRSLGWAAPRVALDEDIAA